MAAPQHPQPKPPSAPPVAAGPPVNLFPRKPDIALKSSKKFDAAVAKAVGDIVAARKAPANFAITIVDASTFEMGGWNGDTEYYSGSVVKIGIMFAAYALLDMLKRYLNLRAPKTADDLFKGLQGEMNGAIAQSSKLIFGAVPPKEQVPDYRSMFRVIDLKTKQIGFNHNYQTDLKRMIVNSDNDAGSNCIHGTGFGYVNGVLEQGGFFDPGAKTGVWAAGDFRHGWTPVRIPCKNLAKGTAQGATTEALARLTAVIVLGSVLDDHSHGEMSNLLKTAATGHAPSFLSRKDRIKDGFDKAQVTHAKIGIGEDPDVYSEVEILAGIADPKKSYIVAWQNIDYRPYWEGDIVTILRSAIGAYEHP